ncbi:MAG TPA: peptidoglycan-binding domain-containing protein [Reyranella sp.]|nr:peptidoglycan-binding domain-containing protein [Reyranella sp.]
MQSHSPPPPFRRPTAMHAEGPAPGGPRPGDRNEFADAVARMFEHRQQAAPDFAPPLRDDVRAREDLRMRDDVRVRAEADDWDAPRPSILGALVSAPALRRALAIVPLAVLGYVIAWFLYFEPSQNVTAKSVVEAKPEAIRAAAPVEPPRPEVAEAKPAPTPAPATVTPASPPPPAVATPSRPLSKDEIKELQGKLGAAGFTAGPIDGVVGPQTQAALRRYAQSRSLAKPPEPTQETLLRLRSETQATQ